MNSGNTYTTFYIIRHGETDWNAQRLLQGHADIPLNEIGESQAQKLASELQDIHFDMIFSSDLLRAKRTAEIIALEKKLAIQTRQTLRERHYGSFEGKHGSIFDTVDKLRDTMSDEENFKYKPGGEAESDEEITIRLITFIREVALAYPGKSILTVCHGGTMFGLLVHLGILSYQNRAYIGAIKNTACVTLQSDGVEFIVKQIKGVHLPQEKTVI